MLAAGFPEIGAGTSVDRQCGSSQQAAHFAAQGVMAGAYDVVIAGGRREHDPGADGRVGHPRQPALRPEDAGPLPERGGLVPQGISAELIAEKWNISREDNDRFSVESHQQRGAGHARRAASTARSCPIEVTTEDGDAA